MTMNISSLQPLNTKYMRIAYVTIVASVLLLASIALIGPSVASGDDDDEEVSGTGTLSSIPGPFISVDTIDGLIIRTRVIEGTWTGVLDGTSVAHQTLSAVGSQGIYTFSGTVGDSAPGTMVFMLVFTADTTACPPSTPGFPASCDPGSILFNGKIAVIEGTGFGGLEGICGGGDFGGSAPPPVSTYDVTFRFGDGCNDDN